MSLQGEYEHEEGDIDAVPIQITHGYSKDHRPDLKQFSMVMSDNLPVFIRALSGNTSDKNRRKKNMGGHCRRSGAKTRYGSGTVRDIRRRICERFPVSYTHLTLPTKRIV